MEHSAERRVRLRRTTLTNLGLFAFSAAMTAVSGNQAFLAEAAHDAGDSAAHGSRYFAETRGIDQHSTGYRRVRQGTMLAVSTLSAWTAMRLGVDVLNGAVEQMSTGQEALQIGSSVVLAGGNVYAFTQMDAVEEHSHASHDSHHHAKVDMVASLGLAASIAADAFGVDGASQWGGAAFAAYTAVEMFPTKHRLESH